MAAFSSHSSFLIPHYICRGDRIRTCGRLVPNQERYRAALHPVAILGNAVPRICGCKGTTFFRDMQIFLQLFNNILLFKYFFEYLNASFHLFFGMSGH